MDRRRLRRRVAVAADSAMVTEVATVADFVRAVLAVSVVTVADVAASVDAKGAGHGRMRDRGRTRAFSMR